MKGMTTVVLNWIFVTIAGAVILLFFFNIISTSGAIKEKEQSSELLGAIHTVLVSKSTAEDTSSILRLSKAVSFSCDMDSCNSRIGCTSFITIDDFQADISIQPIFSPGRINTRNSYVFTKSFDVPFKVLNFLYIAKPGDKFSFPISCGRRCKEVWDSIPQIVKDANIVGKSLTGAKKITFDSCDTVEAGDVCISNTKIVYGGGGTYHILNNAQILGAIFADEELFACNLQKALYRMENTKDVLKGKAIELQQASITINCQEGYKDFYNDLQSYSSDFSELKNITSASLKADNNYLRLNSCGSMY